LDKKWTSKDVFAEFDRAKNYNLQIDLYDKVKVNENFFIGRQWEGLNAPDLDKPVLNFLKRVVTYFIAMIVSDDVTAAVDPFYKTEENVVMSKILSQEIDRVIERTKVKEKNRDAIRAAAVDGDGCFYLRFDPNEKEICVDSIENTRVLFGNPYSADVQAQPYIMVVRRRHIDEIRKNLPKGIDPEDVRPDIEEAYPDEYDSDLVTTVVRMWKEDGKVKFVEATREVMLTEDAVDTGLTLYPIAYFSWEKVRGSYHGQAVIEGLIPNQIAVNTLMAMAIRGVKTGSFPTIIFNKDKISSWTNKVGKAFGVSGDPNTAVATSFRPQDISGQVIGMIDSLIALTKDLMGASDAALGNVRPDNTSAIIAVQRATAAPLELQRMAFFGFVEQYVRIMVDMMRAYYSVREVAFESEAGESIVKVDFDKVDFTGMDINVDVGSCAYFSELMQMQTMDNLYKQGIIGDAVTYLEAIPPRYIRNREKLLSDLKERQKKIEAEAEKIALYGNAVAFDREEGPIGA